MVDFEKWLEIRYIVDAKSRNKKILEQFLEYIPEKTRYKIIDIGSGIGANVRYLSKYIPGNQNWNLVEIDRSLLDKTTDYISDVFHINVEFHQSFTLDQKEIILTPHNQNILDDDISEKSVDIAVANAVFDLFSEDQFDKLISKLKAPFLYFTLNFVGMEFIPSQRNDKKYIDLYIKHMRRKQEFGIAMGASCSSVMINILQKHKYETLMGSSNWKLTADNKDLQFFILKFMKDAIPDLLSKPKQLKNFHGWINSVKRRIANDKIKIVVKHKDIFAFKM